MSEMMPRPMNVGIQYGSLSFLQRVAEGEREIDSEVVRLSDVPAFSFTEAIL